MFDNEKMLLTILVVFEPTGFDKHFRRHTKTTKSQAVLTTRILYQNDISEEIETKNIIKHVLKKGNVEINKN